MTDLVPMREDYAYSCMSIKIKRLHIDKDLWVGTVEDPLGEMLCIKEGSYRNVKRDCVRAASDAFVEDHTQ